MKNFVNWGVRIRKNKELNYYSIWYNLLTVRVDLGDTMELPCDRSEFYDVGLGTKCNAECPFCYVSALKGGDFWPSVCETWKNWIKSMKPDITIDSNNLPEDEEILKELLSESEQNDDKQVSELKATVNLYKHWNLPITITEKPLQIAIGSTGEPTIHPEFCRFLKTVYESGVVPNYTTNGIILSNIKDKKCREILKATSLYCGGVAVSFGNKRLRAVAKQAIKNLINYGDCKVMIHHLISDMESVNELVSIAKEYKGKIHYHVLLPLMRHGRSDKGLEEGVFEYLAEELRKNNITNIALGANFTPSLKSHPGLFNIYEYPQETYSKNILLKKKNEVTITPSSYNLSPIKIINLHE